MKWEKIVHFRNFFLSDFKHYLIERNSGTSYLGPNHMPLPPLAEFCACILRLLSCCCQKRLNTSGDDLPTLGKGTSPCRFSWRLISIFECCKLSFTSFSSLSFIQLTVVVLVWSKWVGRIVFKHARVTAADSWEWEKSRWATNSTLLFIVVVEICWICTNYSKLHTLQ